MLLEEYITDERNWPTFDGWCVEKGIDLLELPSDRALNLIYYFITRNMDEKQRTKFDNQLQSVRGQWIKLSVQRVLTSVQGEGRVIDAEPIEGLTSTQQRERRLPPRPAWYGSRDQATLSTMAAKQTLTSRNGKKRT